MADDIAGVIEAMAGGIESLGETFGLVHRFNVRDHDDMYDLVQRDIAGVRTMRAWWVEGPILDSDWLTEASPRFVQRRWTFEIHGIEGNAPGFDGDTRPSGAEFQTLRNNAVAVCDVLDGLALDEDLNGSAFRSWPCRWLQKPRWERFGTSQFEAAHIAIEKRAMTMPARI